jgi:hypothetical protein
VLRTAPLHLGDDVGCCHGLAALSENDVGGFMMEIRRATEDSCSSLSPPGPSISKNKTFLTWSSGYWNEFRGGFVVANEPNDRSTGATLFVRYWAELPPLPQVKLRSLDGLRE